MSKRFVPRTDFPNPSPRTAARSKNSIYEAFDLIDGRHPWQESVPDGYVPYPVRRLNRGRVAYFNFSLAREMGLIPVGHPQEMNPTLAQKILDTFAVQIINEFDQLTGRMRPKDARKPNPYMATRYLQLQHANKQGKTSGDGRSVWNGTFRHKGITWDISSRGTGVTCLAPGSVEANRPLKTGEGTFGYGCGLADISELYGSTIMSEIFHLNDIGTERSLAIIDLGKGVGIGVRAAPNLLRPAHLFLYLKQGRPESLRAATDYLIQRQIENGVWQISPTNPDRYRIMLKEIALAFARFAAKLERSYIFAWLDWDGDNVLASAGIIDYGSIRQFGLRHDQYRYDDIQRYSTNLNEQRGKARLTVQVFAQLVSYLETGERKPLSAFANHVSLREFDREFDRWIRSIFLSQIGFSDADRDLLLTEHVAAVEEFHASFSTLERTKTKAGLKRLPDGINRPAVFNMRAALREIPAALLREMRRDPRRAAKAWSSGSPLPLSLEEILGFMSSSHAKKADLRLKGALRKRLARFQRAYMKVLKLACGSSTRIVFLRGVTERAHEANHAGRITGNGTEFIVDAILRARRRGLSLAEIQSAIDLFIASQSPKHSLPKHRPRPTTTDSNVGQLYQELVNIAFEFEEDI